MKNTKIIKYKGLGEKLFQSKGDYRNKKTENA